MTYRLIATIVIVLVADRALLAAEARGWINYRRNGLSRGAASYHTLQLSSMLEPGMENVIETKYAQEEQEDSSGDPPVDDGTTPGNGVQ